MAKMTIGSVWMHRNYGREAVLVNRIGDIFVYVWLHRDKKGRRRMFQCPADQWSSRFKRL